MFEVEQKFNLSESQKVTLLEDAEFVSDKRIVDAYYDSVEFVLTTKDWWLRKRDNGFELKVSVETESGEFMKTYREIEDA
jgi:adenylate cyclase class IV